MLVVYQQLLLLTLNRFLFNTPDYDVTEKEHVLTIPIINFRRTVVIKNCKGNDIKIYGYRNFRNDDMLTVQTLFYVWMEFSSFLSLCVEW